MPYCENCAPGCERVGGCPTIVFLYIPKKLSMFVNILNFGLGIEDVYQTYKI